MPGGLNNVADQMRVKPAKQDLMRSMVDMVARMERSNQAMMDLMSQQSHSRIPEQGMDGIWNKFRLFLNKRF